MHVSSPVSHPCVAVDAADSNVSDGAATRAQRSSLVLVVVLHVLSPVCHSGDAVDAVDQQCNHIQMELLQQHNILTCALSW
jgi:hypothetical protein